MPCLHRETERIFDPSYLEKIENFFKDVSTIHLCKTQRYRIVEYFCWLCIYESFPTFSVVELRRVTKLCWNILVDPKSSRTLFWLVLILEKMSRRADVNLDSIDKTLRWLNNCEICKRNFVSRQALNQHHLRIHSGKTPKFLCSKCGKTYTSKSSLDSHEKVCHLLEYLKKWLRDWKSELKMTKWFSSLHAVMELHISSKHQDHFAVMTSRLFSNSKQ